MEPMTAREYADAHGSLCPWCRSGNIEGVKGIEAEGPTAWQRIRCRDCGREWDDSYKLIGYEVPE